MRVQTSAHLLSPVASACADHGLDAAIMAAAESSCALTTLTVHNSLSDSLRLSWVADPTPATVPPARRWLPPRGQQTLELPASGGWLVGERLVWRGVVGVGATASPTHVVRRGVNISVGAGATTLLPALPALTPNASSADESFVLVRGQEQGEPLTVQLCSEPPAPSGVAWRHKPEAHVCHGALVGSSRRYLRGLPAGTTLLAYEAVWGVGESSETGRAEAAAAAAARSERVERIQRALPLSRGAQEQPPPYLAAYLRHVEGGAPKNEAGAAAGELRVHNHLRDDVLLCAPAAGAAGADVLTCAVHLRGLSHAPLLSSDIEEGRAWRFFGLAQTLELASREPALVQLSSPLAPPRAASASPPASPAVAAALPPSPPPPPPAPPGWWTVVNGHDAPMRVCELPDAAATALRARLASAGDGDAALPALLASGEVTLRCLAAAVDPGVSAPLQPPPDARAVPRSRAVVALRPLQPLPTRPWGGGAGAGAGGVSGETEIGVGEASVSAPSSAVELNLVRPTTTTPVATAAVPPRPAARAAQCAAAYKHEAVSEILGAIDRGWANLTAALEAGQVPLDFPSDVVEMGTDADPTRRVLLTKAIGALPHTHPLAILSPRCDAGGAPTESRAACHRQLDGWLARSLSHGDMVLNATATFRAPLPMRHRLYEAPFLFNVECAALLCAYTRLIAKAPPHATRQAAFKVAAGHAAPFNSRKQLEDMFALLARRFAGRPSLTLTEFAAGNMYGGVFMLSALAKLGVREVKYRILDKEYAEWLKAHAAHPAPTPTTPPPTRGGASSLLPPRQLPYAIDWEKYWAEWTAHVEEVAPKEVGVEQLMAPDTQPVRSLVMAVLEAAQRRLDDASATLHQLEHLDAALAGRGAASDGAAGAAGDAKEAREEARRSLHRLLTAPLAPIEHVSVEAVAASLPPREDGAPHGAANATALSELASALQTHVAEQGAPAASLVEARDKVHPLAEEYNGKLWTWVRERQSAALHAWACALGVRLDFAAFSSKDDFLAANAPMASQLVMGMDLDPASTDDFRHVVAQTLAPDGYVVAGIQQTETEPKAPATDAAEDASDGQATMPPPPPPPPPRHVGHSHTARGNAYNFASTPQHAASFDLVGGQLGGVPCFRSAAGAPLGCVEVAHNWYASLCQWGSHLSNGSQVAAALAEYAAGWPIGGIASERCAAQRHFHGWHTPPTAAATAAAAAGQGGGGSHGDGDGDGDVHDDGGETPVDGGNVRNRYLLRQLMGWCMFHGCKQDADFAATEPDTLGVAPLSLDDAAPAGNAPLVFV